MMLKSILCVRHFCSFSAMLSFAKLLIKTDSTVICVPCMLVLGGGGGGALRSFSYGYVPTWWSNPTLSKIFRHTKILPCLNISMKNTPCRKYQHEKHTLYKKLAFGTFWEEDIQLLRRIQILYRIHCMQN